MKTLHYRDIVSSKQERRLERIGVSRLTYTFYITIVRINIPESTKYRFLYKSHNFTWRGYFARPRKGSMAYIFLPDLGLFNVRRYIFKRPFNKENGRLAPRDPPFLFSPSWPLDCAMELHKNHIREPSRPIYRFFLL